MFDSLRRLISGNLSLSQGQGEVGKGGPVSDKALDVGLQKGSHEPVWPAGKEPAAELVAALRLVESSDLASWSRTVSRRSAVEHHPKGGKPHLPEGYRARLGGLDIVIGRYHPRISEGFEVTRGGPAIVVNDIIQIDPLLGPMIDRFESRVESLIKSRDPVFGGVRN